MASIDALFTTTYHTKQLNPWPNSSASHVVNYSQLFTCQGDMQPSKGDPSTCGCLISLRNKPQQKQPELLVNAYSYCLMVKSVSCCCVRGRCLFSNLVTYSIRISTCYIYTTWILSFSLMFYPTYSGSEGPDFCIGIRSPSECYLRTLTYSRVHKQPCNLLQLVHEGSCMETCVPSNKSLHLLELKSVSHIYPSLHYLGLVK